MSAAGAPFLFQSVTISALNPDEAGLAEIYAVVIFSCFLAKKSFTKDEPARIKATRPT